MNKVILVISLLLAPSLWAKIPEELKLACHQHNIVTQNSDTVVVVTDVIWCNNMFSQTKTIEVEVQNRRFNKEIYIYDYNLPRDQRSAKIKISANEASNHLPLPGESYYLGHTVNGKDRFLITLPGFYRTEDEKLAFEIYIKMDDEQYMSRNITTEKWIAPANLAQGLSCSTQSYTDGVTDGAIHLTPNNNQQYYNAILEFKGNKLNQYFQTELETMNAKCFSEGGPGFSHKTCKIPVRIDSVSNSIFAGGRFEHGFLGNSSGSGFLLEATFDGRKNTKNWYFNYCGNLD